MSRWSLWSLSSFSKSVASNFPHAGEAYTMMEVIKAWYTRISSSEVKLFLKQRMTYKRWEASFRMFEICAFQSRRRVKMKPRVFTQSAFLKLQSTVEMAFGDRIMRSNLHVLRFSIRPRWSKREAQVAMEIELTEAWLREMDSINVMSSAYLTHWTFDWGNEIEPIKAANRYGPRTEPCGTPERAAVTGPRRSQILTQNPRAWR